MGRRISRSGVTRSTAAAICLLATSGWTGCSGSSAPQGANPQGGAAAQGGAGAGAGGKAEGRLAGQGGAGVLAAGSGGMRAQASAGAGGGAAAGSGGQGGGSGQGGAAVGSGGQGGAGAVTLPPLNAGLDYQLGGAYAPADSVKIVSRDRQARPAAGLYNICYVNGFQAQQQENDFWLSQHPDLILRDQAGEPVIDQDWNEMLLDVSTADKRKALAVIVSGWIDGCAADGFNAVEIDNLDSYARSGDRLKEQDAVDFVRLLADAAHARGLAIAQKNASELVPRRVEMGTDFVVAEECNRYDECDAYRQGYDDHVLVIEYRRSDFEAGCAAYPQLSIVLRDLNLVSKGQSGYVFDGC